jgi:hypothetical protein
LTAWGPARVAELVGITHPPARRLNGREGQLFYDFCLDDRIPEDHLLRRITAVLDLSDVRQKLAPYYSAIFSFVLARNPPFVKSRNEDTQKARKHAIINKTKTHKHERTL